mmetsp:Transcript_2912/g.5284  ORF Transcript_2912/g.5284 Transcript_2912/m.5284 type:complete len:88 (+) Transcript_2912:976-1239(+)
MQGLLVVPVLVVSSRHDAGLLQDGVTNRAGNRKLFAVTDVVAKKATRTTNKRIDLRMDTVGAVRETLILMRLFIVSIINNLLHCLVT